MRAIEDAKKLGIEKDIAIQRGNLANVYKIWGRLDAALATHQELWDYFRGKGDRGNEAVSLHQIGMIHYSKGEYNEALEKYNTSLEIKEELGDRAGIAMTLGQLGRVKLKQKNYYEAIGAFATAASLFKELESPYFEMAIKDLASVRGDIGEEKFNKIIKELQKEGE